MAKTAFRAQMEPLERRDNPSAVTALATATTHHVVNVSGSGNGFVLELSNQINGVAIQTAVNGRAAGLGVFSGTTTGFNNFNGRATGSAVLTDARGDQLDLTLNGSASLSSTPTKTHGFPRLLNGSPKRAFTSYRFNVTGGTGAFAGATGSGSLSESISAATGALTFSFNGQVRT